MRQWQPMIIEMSSRREMIDIVIAHRHLYCDHHHHRSAKLTDCCDAAPEPGRQRQHRRHPRSHPRPHRSRSNRRQIKIPERE